MGWNCDSDREKRKYNSDMASTAIYMYQTKSPPPSPPIKEGLVFIAYISTKKPQS